MSPDTDDEDQATRPISVAELLARNGAIGAPPAGGHRRRRRGNSAAVSVAELTGEIPVIRDEPMVAATEAEVEPAEAVEETTEPAEVEAEAEPEAEPAVEPELEAEAEAEPEPAVEPELEAEPEPEPEAEPESAAIETAEAAEEVRTAPPLADDPRPRRGGKLERGYDPRPRRRSSGAEQMAYDPVDESVDLAELVADQAAEDEALRSYLKASGGTLFSGETVADDLARQGIDDAEPGETASAPPKVAGARLGALRQGVIAVLQSVLAVVFGAGLFLGFDQLWRWNTIVALALSVLVILGLVIAVRVVRKTEDIASTLIAVAVGALVTLGPLALLQSYG